MPFLKIVATFGFCCALSAAAGVDLRNAIIVISPQAASPEKKAAQMLTEEIAKRTQIRLPVRNSAAEGRPVIALGVAAELAGRVNGLSAATPGADGYRVKAGQNGVVIAGNDPRGALFGAGYLLR
ncbi:MAG: glycoside hydrolase family 20 zincin-like fold domain-containing protein, partial [Bryobacteraceae bacterium]